ncbi:M3 family metallopeptidase [Prevotella sp. kh1p2]|uniref:M3 family metallopeptidase n=1 Tax=Prevotella sp. kh1p2 TaxID=1761883 RepID=UPI0008AD6998|nr:M3 family metallopeptidase [Prevotella sp. kh1p2]SES62546.1 peptidyl-dipeptidase Dcp [Prevotella sp. kh1p2]SNU10219.1 peptidyl-dipeptidase Dcp [Prevotellaceae bacterium KH2P17]
MSENQIETSQRTNPFFTDYHTPHDTVPFDRIGTADYEEAFMEGIRRDDEAIDKLVNDPETPTFENTLTRVDLSHGEHYYDLLDRVSNVFSCMLSAETNDELDALAQKMSPILTRHANDVSLNSKLFERIKYVHDHPNRPLNAEEQMLLDTSYDGFVRSGALLDDEGKAKLRQLTEEAGVLTLQFSQNLLKENKAYELHITDEQQLDGLPETARAAAAQAAKERGKDGWVFTLDFPSFSPFMTYSTQRELRKQMYMARNTVCTHANEYNNLDICKRLVNLRREMAQLLGYNTYADYVLQHRMASNTANVYKLLNDLIDAYRPAAIKEVEAIEAIAARDVQPSSPNTQYPSPTTQHPSPITQQHLSPNTQHPSPATPLRPWDFGYYSHKLQMERYNLDAEMLRPYFKLENVIKGVFGLATKLYGITFRENNEIPVYHPDVKAYEVFDQDGSYLAVLYADFYPRKGKQGGAWMTEFQGQWIDYKGRNIRPHVSLVMNLTKPTADKPALLTLGEVETFLHEFGHSLHGMLANTRFQSLSGTNVWWDFVELPSQFMENYAVEKDFLRTFAFHYQTGEPIPDELIDRIVRSRNFNAAYACMRQVSFGLLDMAYYTKADEFTEDIIPFEKKAWEKAIIMPQLPDTCMTVQFSHIMAGGYAAGYYSYKWAEVLDADAFSVFKKNGIFDRKTARSFRDNILSRGGTEHPMTLYKRFRGQEPTIDALLERNGIKTKH